MRIDCWSLSLDPTPARQTVPVFRGVLRNLECLPFVFVYFTIITPLWGREGLSMRSAVRCASLELHIFSANRKFWFSQPEFLMPWRPLLPAHMWLDIVQSKCSELKTALRSLPTSNVDGLKDSLFWEFAVSPICLSFVFHWGMGSVVSRHYFLSWGLVRSVPADLVSLSLYGLAFIIFNHYARSLVLLSIQYVLQLPVA